VLRGIRASNLAQALQRKLAIVVRFAVIILCRGTHRFDFATIVLLEKATACSDIKVSRRHTRVRRAASEEVVVAKVLVLYYSGHAGQMTLEEVTGGSPYGATTIAGGDGSRQPTANELQGARYQGRKVAETAKRLHG